MDLGLKDKICIVTGGGKGIGWGIVKSLVNEGAVPVILSRSDLDKEATKWLENKNAKYGFYKIDLRQNEKIKAMVDDIVQKYGLIYALINNAGANDNLSLQDTDYKEFMHSLEGNLTHYYTLAHCVLPYLIKSQGTILNISSKTAVTGQGATSAYAAAKGAQLALTREWAAALAKYKIRVNAVIPAEVMTPLYERWLQNFDDPKTKYENIAKNIPLEQRFTTSEEIADTVVFTISKRASHTTGQILYVDGGYVHLDRALN